MLEEKILGLVAADSRNLYQAGCDSINQGDLDGAISLFNQSLDKEPGFVLCREALRRAQLARARNRNGFFEHAWDEMCEIPELAEAEAYLHTQPLKAIHAAEQVLNNVPNNILAHRILAQAALKTNMPRTALLSLNFIYPRVRESLNIALELASALGKTGHVREAISICGRLLKENPGSKRVTRLLGYFSRLAADEYPNSARANHRPAPQIHRSF